MIFKNKKAKKKLGANISRWAGIAGIMASLTVAPCLQAAAPTTLRPLNEQGLKQLIARNRGKVLLLNFWSQTCPPCIASYPKLVQMGKKYRGKGLQIVSVNVIDNARTRQTWSLPFVKKQKPGFPTYYLNAKNESAFIRMIDPKWQGELPADFLYAPNGKKIRSYMGEVNMATLDAHIRQQLARLPKSRSAAR